MRLEPFHIAGLVRYFLDKGDSVCYIDGNMDRREDLHRRLGHMSGELSICTPLLYDFPKIHCNVLITVNEYGWDEVVQKELINIPGVMKGRMPAHIRLSI